MGGFFVIKIYFVVLKSMLRRKPCTLNQPAVRAEQRNTFRLLARQKVRFREACPELVEVAQERKLNQHTFTSPTFRSLIAFSHYACAEHFLRCSH